MICPSCQQLQTSPEYGQGMNPISRLAQIQQAKKEKEPEYSMVTERGLPRRREFVMQVNHLQFEACWQSCFRLPLFACLFFVGFLVTSIFCCRWLCAARLQKGWGRVRRWPRGMPLRKCWNCWDIKCLSLNHPNQHSNLMKRYCSIFKKSFMNVLILKEMQHNFYNISFSVVELVLLMSQMENLWNGEKSKPMQLSTWPKWWHHLQKPRLVHWAPKKQRW